MTIQITGDAGSGKSRVADCLLAPVLKRLNVAMSPVSFTYVDEGVVIEEYIAPGSDTDPDAGTGAVHITIVVAQTPEDIVRFRNQGWRRL